MVGHSHSSSSSSWFSPKFAAAGCTNLQLELVFYAGGSCLLRMWADTGFRALLKLYVGGTVEELQHTFDSISPCCMTRCTWEDAMDKGSDTLQVGVEILEGFRVVNGASKRCAAVMSQSVDQMPQGSLALHRYICPGLTDRLWNLEYQWDRLRSRMVARVEWHVEQVLLMQQVFSKGEPLCSSLFTAGGVNDLQFVFYPSGDSDARDHYCSLYVHCREGDGTALRCWLSAGKQRREGQVVKQRPGLIGRSNFCLFESCSDKGSDTMTLVLEIAEAQQHGADTQKPLPLSVPWPALAQPEADNSQLPGYEDVLEKSSRLEGAPGRVSLQDVKQLPSIWTPKVFQSEDAGAAHPAGFQPLWNYRPMQPQSNRQPVPLPDGCALFCDIAERPKPAREVISPRRRAKEKSGLVSRPQSRSAPTSGATTRSPTQGFRTPTPSYQSARSPTPGGASPMC